MRQNVKLCSFAQRSPAFRFRHERRCETCAYDGSPTMSSCGTYKDDYDDERFH